MSGTPTGHQMSWFRYLSCPRVLLYRTSTTKGGETFFFLPNLCAFAIIHGKTENYNA